MDGALEVRRCARCGAAAATCVRDWKTSVYGVTTGGSSLRDFVCQSCGAAFTWRPPRSRLLHFVLFALPVTFFAFVGVCGGILTLANEGNVGGLVFAGVLGPLAAAAIAFTTEPWRVDRKNPVVPDAPSPPIRYTAFEPGRRCSCGSVARATKIVRTGSWGGIETTYECAACRRSFVVDSARQAIFMSFASLVALALGAGLLSTASGQGIGAWLCAGSIALLGVFGAVSIVWRLVERVRHPIAALPTQPPTPGAHAA